MAPQMTDRQSASYTNLPSPKPDARVSCVRSRLSNALFVSGGRQGCVSGSPSCNGPRPRQPHPPTVYSLVLEAVAACRFG